jgi:hypothetical protein
VLNAEVTERAAPEDATTSQPAHTSLVELDDEEILAWLSTSILDDPDPLDPAQTAPSQDFWERVAAAEANFEAMGWNGQAALDRAIGLVGLELSITSGAAQTVDAPSAFSLGEKELLALSSDILERAGRAVAIWASLQGSALRAANQAKG